MPASELAAMRTSILYECKLTIYIKIRLHQDQDGEIAMYSKVIVPLDGSELAEQAMPYAQLVAGGLSIPIELVQAFDIVPPVVHNQGSMYAVDQMLEDARQRSHHYLARVRETLRAAGHAASSSILPNAPHHAIEERASGDPDALIVMSTHGRGGITRWALGSVTDKVLHTVPNPVLIIRAAAEHSPAAVETVLVPLDGSDLAETSLEHAVNLAAAVDAVVALARVTHTREYYRRHLTGPRAAIGPSPAGWVNDLMRADAEAATDYLVGVQRRLAAERPDAGEIDILHLRHESPAQAIIDQAAEPKTLVVMTTHGRSGIRRMLMGSVTDRVVRHSNAPVLVVRNWPEPAHEHIGELAPAAGA